MLLWDYDFFLSTCCVLILFRSIERVLWKTLVDVLLQRLWNFVFGKFAFGQGIETLSTNPNPTTSVNSSPEQIIVGTLTRNSVIRQVSSNSTLTRGTDCRPALRIQIGGSSSEECFLMHPGELNKLPMGDRVRAVGVFVMDRFLVFLAPVINTLSSSAVDRSAALPSTPVAPFAGPTITNTTTPTNTSHSGKQE